MAELGAWLDRSFWQPQWLWLLLLVPLAGVARARGGSAEAAWRRITGTALRLLALTLLVVILAGPLAGTYSRQTDVIFALDVSRSIDREASAQALDFVNRALAAKSPDARIGLVVFGAGAQVEALLRRSPEPVTGIAAHVGAGGTDIGRAIETAVGAFPAAEHRRVVLLSDGQENLGDARAAAAVARSIGVEIVSVPLRRAGDTAEVAVTGIAAPSRVAVHEPFHVEVGVRSNSRGTAQLLVLRDGVVLEGVNLEPAPGANTHRFVEESSRAGLHEYEVIVNAPRDSVQENNRYQRFVEVAGPPKVLHAAGRTEEFRAVSAALRAQGLLVDEVPATAVPGSLHRIADYDLVVLNNVSGFDLSLAKMDLLEEYVRDAGGGVIALGGDRSYGAGGYYDTPVERLLPVTMDVKSAVKIPSLAVVFVLDRSGSMGSRSHGEEKLTLARNAALASIELLNRLDRVGVLAFDDTPEWVVPPTEVGNRRPIARRLARVGAGGSTDLVKALEEAHRVMSRQQAKVKHLIVLSDGLAGSDVSFDAFGERIKADGITVSTVALGLDADRALMAELAALGSGRYYHTDDPRNIPRIFTSETMVVARDLVVEGETRPRVGQAGEIIAGFDEASFPALLGYQRVFAKPAAQVLLASGAGEPLLASWRLGLGKAVAFTSDLSGRWGREWVQWPDFGRFVAQLARWSMRRSGRETLRPAFRWQGQRGEVLVDVLDRDERFVNGLAVEASVTGPDRDVRVTTLEQISPGRYRGEFPVPRDGRYYVTLSGDGEGISVGPRTFGLAVPYSEEFRDLGVDRDLMDALAATTGGSVLPLTPASLPPILAHKPAASAERWRIWWPLLAAALVALLLEVVVRKLVLPESWRRRGAGEGALSSDEVPEPAYEALRETMAGRRADQLAALREQGFYDSEDPAVRARLYMARRSAGR